MVSLLSAINPFNNINPASKSLPQNNKPKPTGTDETSKDEKDKAELLREELEEGLGNPDVLVIVNGLSRCEREAIKGNKKQLVSV